MNKQYNLHITPLILLFAALTLLGCKKDEGPKSPQRTVLVYMLANNSLYDDAYVDINEMEYAWDDALGGKLIVFFNSLCGENTLYEICHDTDMSTINSKVLHTYPATSEVASQVFINSVISEVKSSYPADSYGLDLWAHGHTWFPYFSTSATDNITIVEDDIHLGFLGDSDTHIEICDLSQVLSQYHFDFIIMDACYMAGAECIYQMKDICDYYISSAAETNTGGFPYDVIVPYMFSQPANVVGIASAFYEYYMGKTGIEKSATVSTVDCSKMEAVAKELKKIVTKNPDVPFQTIQQYGRYDYEDMIYDLEDFVQKTWGETESYSFSKALQEAVIYKANTPKIRNSIVINHHCGISCFIPRQDKQKYLTVYKKDYSWATDSGLGAMLE